MLEGETRVVSVTDISTAGKTPCNPTNICPSPVITSLARAVSLFEVPWASDVSVKLLIPGPAVVPLLKLQVAPPVVDEVVALEMENISCGEPPAAEVTEGGQDGPVVL